MDFKILEVGGVDDSLTLRESGKDAYIEIDNPWSGDTETGFGRSVGFRLTRQQAVELAAKLLEWARK